MSMDAASRVGGVRGGTPEGCSENTCGGLTGFSGRAVFGMVGLHGGYQPGALGWEGRAGSCSGVAFAAAVGVGRIWDGWQGVGGDGRALVGGAKGSEEQLVSCVGVLDRVGGIGAYVCARGGAASDVGCRSDVVG